MVTRKYLFQEIIDELMDLQKYQHDHKLGKILIYSYNCPKEFVERALELQEHMRMDRQLQGDIKPVKTEAA